MARRVRARYFHPPAAGSSIVIDEGGVRGDYVAPGVREVEVEIADARTLDPGPNLAEHKLRFVHAPSCVREPADLDARREAYEAELRALLDAQLHPREIVIVDHILRGPGARPPAGSVHSDYSARAATKRVGELLGDRAPLWLAGEFAVVNVWRPLSRPVARDPLGFVLPATVDASDWFDVDVVFPHRTAQVRGLAFNPAHRFVYLDAMTPDEVAVFEVYANGGVDGIPHGAVELLDAPPDAPARSSVESRVFVRM